MEDLKPQQPDEEYVPGMMLILRASAEAADMTVMDLMSGSRTRLNIYARVTAYTIAVEYGYPREQVMWYLDRDRTASYNYDRNYENHLRKDRLFKTIYATAIEILTNHTFRSPKSPRGALNSQIRASLKSNGSPKRWHDISNFESHDTGLGFKFTAEEMRSMALARHVSALYMARFGRGRKPSKTTVRKRTAPPEKMSTHEASEYLCLSHAALATAARNGAIPSTRTENNRYVFNRSDLDAYKERVTTKNPHLYNRKPAE